MSVWDDLVGQEPAVAVLRKAVDGAAAALRGERGPAVAGMTHAWLITGPPGSGRSNGGRAFAAALQCANNGCGECNDCRTALSGAHPDVSLIRTELLSIRVSEVRELVRRAAMSPTQGRWQVMVVEDADRLTEQAADALLKSIEEPSPRTVWVLCAPTVEDVVPTIRSRCRLLVLRTPPVAAVAEMLSRTLEIGQDLAWFAARAAQGHIGRARALARDEAVREPAEQGARGAVRAARSRGLPEGGAAAGRGGQGRGQGQRGEGRREGAGRARAGARRRHQGRQAARGERGAEGARGPAEGARQAVGTRCSGPFAGRPDGALPRCAGGADRVRQRADQRRTAAQHRAARRAGRRPSRRSAGSTRSRCAARRSRRTSRRCSRSRR